MRPSLKTPESSYPTRYWRETKHGRIRCDLCPRACELQEGQRGMCFVRACENKQIVLTSYARSSGFCIDPIEKKPLFHFLPGSSVLSFGTAGCNLACKYCQNWDISKSRELDTLMDSASAEELVRVAKKYQCQSVAFTYNDPVVFFEYALDVAKACRAEGIKTVAVTAGYISAAPRAEFFRYIDAANIDLKAFQEDFYYKVTGGHLQPVLETLRYVYHETDTWLELTTLLIPGKNDSEDEIDAMTKWVVANLGPDVPMHFSGFHPNWKMLELPSTPAASLQKARDIALANGVRYAYIGNVHDESRATTYCHECGTRLVGRDWYKITHWQLSAGNCPECGAACSGLFAKELGRWGAKRQLVRIQTAAKR